ncbi:MAG TPA: hypothetical protein VFS66_06375 [Acidimicrobiia bacterium]|nr:hypothetical protein [Acidimicrobiia bacterium]
MSTAGTNLVPEPDFQRSAYHRVGLADRAMATLDETSSVCFEAIVELQGPVDETALGEAWERLADFHSILTCVRDGAVWRPMPLGHAEPLTSLRISPVADGLRLTMLCNHVAFDGVASRILLGDLRDEYESVLAGEPARPPDWSPRTLEAYSAGTDWRGATTAALRSASSWWRAPMSTHVDPAPIPDQPATEHALLELGPVLEALTPVRRKYHWSVDAVLVGVLEKAWSAVFGPPSAESSWLVARDLRSTLGWDRGIGNLSMAAGVSIPDPTADLTTVIDHAEAALASQSPDMVVGALPLGRWRQAADVTFASMLRRSARLRAYRSVSNVGQVGESLDRWGEATLSRIWFVGPLAHPPYNSFIAAGHGSSTLVSVRTSPTWLTEEHARALEGAALDLV